MTSDSRTDPAIEAYTPWLSPRKKTIVGGVVLILALATIISLIAFNVGQAFLEVSEVQQRGPTIHGQDIKINGIIVPGSIVYGDQEDVTFQVLDAKKKSGEPLEVVFAGVPPGQFDVPSVEVVLEGSLEPDNIFHATSIITRESRQYIPVTEQETN